MKTERILNIKTRAEWRNWLLQNFNLRSVTRKQKYSENGNRGTAKSGTRIQ